MNDNIKQKRRKLSRIKKVKIFVDDQKITVTCQ